MNKERVDVRVEQELLEELDTISERLGVESRSAIIREAIATFVLDNKDGWNSTGIKVNLPNRMAERLQTHIMNGDASDAENAIVLALDFWLRDLEDYHMNRRATMEKIVRENMSSDRGLKELRNRGKDLGRP
jgi:predicted DNA-binding protein